MKPARKCFDSGYKIINDFRNNSAIERAKEMAREAGNDIPDRFAGYKEFYIAPNPLFVAISTTEGFIQHLNDLSNDIENTDIFVNGFRLYNDIDFTILNPLLHLQLPSMILFKDTINFERKLNK